MAVSACEGELTRLALCSQRSVDWPRSLGLRPGGSFLLRGLFVDEAHGWVARDHGGPVLSRARILQDIQRVKYCVLTVQVPQGQDAAMGRPLSSDLVGFTTDPAPVSWDDKDVLLYACGVGARPETDLGFLYEGMGPKVLPTYAVVPGMLGMAAILGGGVDIDLMMVLHGEQSIILHREIPARASATVSGRISEVWDKGKAAVIGCEGVVADQDGPLFTAKATIFVRGAGGFGGERGPSTAGRNEPPDRAPDHVVSMETRPEQAAIYRLSGDRNPMHIDPTFATAAGFDGPFLHGLCTYGFVGRAILSALCGGEPARFQGFEARFADRVHCGDVVTTKIWEVAAGEAIVQAEVQSGAVVLSQARATYAA